MKRFVFAAATTALALSAAAAQGQGNPVYGVQAPPPSPSFFDRAQSEPYARAVLSAKQKVTLVSAVQGFRNSCEADRQALCAGKPDRAVGRCLAYHRLRLSGSCKQAMDNLGLAWNGAL